MVDVFVGKSAEDLRREIDELNRQQRELTERLRDPRGLRKGGAIGYGGRGGGTGVGPQRLLGRGLGQRGAIRRGEAIDPAEQPPTKKRLLSAVVKVEEDDEAPEALKDEVSEPQEEKDGEAHEEVEDDRNRHLPRMINNGRRDFRGGRERGFGEDHQTTEPLPRVLPKIDDPNVTKRNRRMFGALLGTLEKFKQEDQKLSGSEAFLRRSTSQRKAEQRAQEESERLRQQEREQLAGKRKRDLVLRARLAAKAEEKQLELLFIQWTEHHTKLSSFLKTKAEPSIFYLPAKPSEETEKLLDVRKEELAEWKSKRRSELTEYQKQATAEHLARVEVEIERWQSRTANANNNDVPGTTAEETEDMEPTGDEERSHGKHGWRKSRLSAVSDSAEEDQREDTLEDAETEGELLSSAVKEPETVDRKEGDGGALKDVMGYGSGDDEMEER